MDAKITTLGIQNVGTCQGGARDPLRLRFVLTKNELWVLLGRPGVMCGGAGEELKGGFAELGTDLERNLAEDLERTFEKGIVRIWNL